MQTFLPYADFLKSAQCLDYRRLGKQRVECLQILNALTGKSKGWVNHPATKMWRGYEGALAVYKNIVIIEWRNRGNKNIKENLNDCEKELDKLMGFDNSSET